MREVDGDDFVECSVCGNLSPVLIDRMCKSCLDRWGYVKVRRADITNVVVFMGEGCTLDNDGYCQAHTLDDDCFMPRFVEILSSAPPAT